MEHLIDLRSDTVTKPTREMIMANLECKYGDDVYEEDPTMNTLQTQIANFFGKEKALFFPSGTMANLTAVMCWGEKRGSEVILGDKSHIFLFEQGSAAQFGGISYKTLPNQEDGTMDLNTIIHSIRDDDIHEPSTCLIAIENTHNACGGKILRTDYLNHLQQVAKRNNLPIHMDGARLWNALQEYDVTPQEIAGYVDSLSVCLSKGLGCPIGSLLVGSKAFIQKAKRIRKALGGGMRQVGFIACAGLIALQDFKNGIIAEDHKKAKLLASSINALTHFTVVGEVESNILFFKPTCSSYKDNEIYEFLKSYNVLVSLWDTRLFRIVVHRDINDEQIIFTSSIFKELDLLIPS